MRDFLLVVFIIGALPVCLMRPWIGILIWSWIGYMNPHRLAWSYAVDMHFAQMVAIAILFGVMADKTRKSLPINFEMGILLCFVVYFTITTFFAWSPDTAWGQWQKVMKILLMVFVAGMVIHGRHRIRWFVLVIVFSLGFFGVKGGLFSITTGGNHLVWGPQGSFIADNNSLGLALIMMLPLAFQMAQMEMDKRLRGVILAIFGFSIMATVFTYSRGALLGLIAVLGMMLIRANKKGLLLLMIGPLLFGIYQMAPDHWFDRTESIQDYAADSSVLQRFQAWDVAWNVAKENPLLGAGFGLKNINNGVWASYTDRHGSWETTSRAAHSIWFQIMGHHGLLVFAMYLLLIFSFYRRLRNLERRGNRIEGAGWISRYAVGLQLGMVGYVSAGSFLSLAYFDLFYTYVVLGAILEREMLAIEQSEIPVAAGKPGFGRAGRAPVEGAAAAKF